MVAVRCITEITPRLGYEYAQDMGITTLHESYDTGTEVLTDIIQPLALGGITEGVTNLELCGAYASIANLGQYIEPKFYTQVLDQYGNVVLDNTSPVSSTAMKSSTAYLLTDAMRGVVEDPEGTAYGQISLGYMPVAGKTGTTSSYKDIWFAGYTPYYTCCVWGGYDNNADLPDSDLYHTYNKVLWTSIMSRIHEGLPVSSFQVPDDVVTVSVCRSSGLAAIPGVCDSYEEVFAVGTQPQQYCNVHGSGSSVQFLDQPETNGSDLAPGAITIFDSDSTTVYPDGTGQTDSNPSVTPGASENPGQTAGGGHDASGGTDDVVIGNGGTNDVVIGNGGGTDDVVIGGSDSIAGSGTQDTVIGDTGEDVITIWGDGSGSSQDSQLTQEQDGDFKSDTGGASLILPLCYVLLKQDSYFTRKGQIKKCQIRNLKQSIRRCWMFISRSPSCYHVISSFSRLLLEEGFEELLENQPWKLKKEAAISSPETVPP